jgi:hypothetical protein
MEEGKLRIELDKYGNVIRVTHYADDRVVYNKDGSIRRVGNVEYKYFVDGEIERIGEISFGFSGNTLMKVGEAAIQYNKNGEVIGIGEDGRVEVVILNDDHLSSNHTERPKIFVQASTSQEPIHQNNPVYLTGSDNAQTRYKDGYSVARQIISYGKFLKTMGVLVGIGIFIGFLFIGRSFGGDSVIGGLVGGLVIGLVVGVILYSTGIFISAMGQLLLASFDTAVNTSMLRAMGKSKTPCGVNQPQKK